MAERQRPAPDPDCRYCSGRGWVVGGDEPRDCYCRGLLATDLTDETSSLRGRRDALRHEDSAQELVDHFELGTRL